MGTDQADQDYVTRKMMMLTAFKKAQQQLIANTSMSMADKKKGKDLLVIKNGVTYKVSAAAGKTSPVIVPGALTGKPSNTSVYSTGGLVKGLTTHKKKKGTTL